MFVYVIGITSGRAATAAVVAVVDILCFCLPLDRQQTDRRTDSRQTPHPAFIPLSGWQLCGPLLSILRGADAGVRDKSSGWLALILRRPCWCVSEVVVTEEYIRLRLW